MNNAEHPLRPSGRAESPSHVEQVMVVATGDLRPFLAGNHLIRERTPEVLHLIASQHFFIDRPTAEVSPQYRQIIPYVVIRHADSFYVLQRTAKQTESRLHHKLSLGIGGHINPGHDLAAGLKKELDEEVRIDDPYELELAGILNDESTEVGRVHLGAVYVLHAAGPRVQVLETEKMSGRFVPRGELAPLREAMESWSQIVYDELIASS
jgi:predicted NUDIX family phosphoesterase